MAIKYTKSIVCPVAQHLYLGVLQAVHTRDPAGGGHLAWDLARRLRLCQGLPVQVRPFHISAPFCATQWGEVDFAVRLVTMPGRHGGDQVHKAKKTAAPLFFMICLQVRQGHHGRELPLGQQVRALSRAPSRLHRDLPCGFACRSALTGYSGA